MGFVGLLCIPQRINTRDRLSQINLTVEKNNNVVRSMVSPLDNFPAQLATPVPRSLSMYIINETLQVTWYRIEPKPEHRV